MIENNEQEFESQVSLNDYLRIMYRGRWIIVLSFIIVFLSTVYFTFTSSPVYEASTSIIIESTGAMERSLFDMNPFGNQSTLIANQIEILKSRTLAERVVKQLDLSDVRDSLQIFQPDDEGGYLTLRSMVHIIQASMEIEHRKETDVIEIKYQAGSPFESAYIANTIADQFQLANSEANRIEINELRKFVETQMYKKGEELRRSEEQLREYQERKKVASLDEETTELVNRLAEVEALFEGAQIELKSKLEMKSSLEEKLEERKETLSSDLSEISTPYINSLQNTLAQLVAERTRYVISVEMEVDPANKRHFQEKIKGYDINIKALKEKLEEEAKKISISSMVQDPFRLSQELVTQLITIDADVKSVSAKINALQDVVRDYNNKLESLPEKVLELARLERRRKVDEQTYILMTQKLEETKIQEAAQSKNVRIIDEAIEPLFPVSPKKKLNIMLGALIGLGLGVGLTFLIEYFDNTIKTHEDLERMGFNILASIPKIEMDKYEKKLESKLEKFGSIEGKKIEARLITHLDPKSPVSESYRTLRTNLQFSKVDRHIKTILVTSSGPKEGKSTTAANLAIAMAQVGHKVALIDADLRRPVIHSIFGLNKDEGITNYLMETISYDKLAKKTFLDNLWIMPCGVLPPNPSELLASRKMEDMLTKLRNDFDIIILDSPPVIAVTDAAILSTKVDGTILVVNSGQTNRDALTRANVLLDNVDTKLLGLLINGIDVDGIYGSYYYYYYHHYYSKPGKKKKNWASRIFSS